MPAGFVGIMATIYLVAKMVGSLVMGRLADRFGAMIVLRVSCICGAVAALLAAFIKDYRLAYVMYAAIGCCCERYHDVQQHCLRNMF